MNKQSYWQHNLYIFAATDSGSTITTVFDALSLCTGSIFGYTAMEIIASATVMNANRSGLWPCHEHYADKQVMPKARHNSEGEEP